MISIDDFKKLSIKIGEIQSAERVPETDKLVRLTVDIGEGEPRQIISGIAKHFPDPTVLIGKKCPFAANLEPKVIKGLESNGMILAVTTTEGGFSLLTPEQEVPSGSTLI